ncbi:MAG: glycoside hydrolase family 13 protein [Eubacteriales bacterium]|nr:glycoside hydrolase family 13 protein [Eubacteriales bacterium]
MKAEHNSHSLFYRNPFGAAECNKEVTLSISIENIGIPKRIELVTNAGRYGMYYTQSLGEYNIYTVVIKLPEKPCKLYYYFEIDTEQGLFYYGNNDSALGGIGRLWDNVPEKKYQITVCSEDYKTPDWFKNSICYQIFPDRFCREGDFKAEKPHMKKRNWGEMPYYKTEQFGGRFDCSDFFGGNFEGIISKLPYLADLGIGAIYLNPIFKAYSNHRYDTGDYEVIDEVLGTEKDFERLCKEAEKYGIRIILDGVFNHTGSDSKYFNKNGTYDSIGAYQSLESPYSAWYRFSSYPEKYESWWGMETLPQVEEMDESYRDYIISGKNSIVKKWLKKGAGGWRLDVADELPDSFIKELRKAVKETDSEAVIIGEVWEDASNKVVYGEEREYLLGDELDSVMNYPLRNALIDFALGRCDAKAFDMRISSIRENYPKETFYSLLNFLSSHDVERIITVLGGDYPDNKESQAAYYMSGEKLNLAKQRLFAVMTLLFLMPGVPCLFYGDEVGVQGFADPFCRACYPWGNEDTEILDKVKTLIKLRQSADSFVSGDMETIYTYDRGYAMLRTGKDGKFVVLANFGGERCIRLDAARFGIKKLTDVNGEEFYAEDGIFYINMEEIGARVLRT